MIRVTRVDDEEDKSLHNDRINIGNKRDVDLSINEVNDDDDDDDDDDEDEMDETDIGNENTEEIIYSKSTLSSLVNHSNEQQQVTIIPNLTKSDQSSSLKGISAMFAPYRTLGIVISSSSFYYVPHQNSLNAMICCSLNDRFCLYKTQHLQPILISQTVPIATNTSQNEMTKSNKKKKSSNKMIGSERSINFCITDPTLSLTVVAHGPSSGSSNNKIMKKHTDTITLYQRTRALSSHLLVTRPDSNWNIQDMIFMGHIKQKKVDGKEGQVENAAIVAVIMAKTNRNSSTEEEDDDSSSNSSSSSSSSSDTDTSSTSDDDEVQIDNNEDNNIQNQEDTDNDLDDEKCCGKVIIFVATRKSLRMHNRISLKSIPKFFPNKAIHPATYLNKILLGGMQISSQNGGVEKAAMCLLNIRTGKVIHVFQCLTTSSKGNMKNKKSNNNVASMITSMEQSPAVDTIAVGTNLGVVHLINLRHDTELFTLHHQRRDSSTSKTNHVLITSISFRNDGSAMQYGVAPMAVGRSDGCITIWDLTPPEDPDMGRTVLCEMDGVHPGGVSKVKYMAQEPLLISSGFISNSLIIHIFDSPDHSARTLRQRKGHSAPPKLVRYLTSGLLSNAADGTDPSLSCNILSSGGADRTLRLFSTVRTVLDKEYSQGKGLQKQAKKLGLNSTAELLLPPVVDMAMCEARSRDWCDLITIHSNHSLAYAWSTQNGAQSGPILKQPSWNVSVMKQPPPPGTNATSLGLSVCGNFAMIGTKGGTIYKYNIQSGLPRGSYPIDAAENDDNDTKSVQNKKQIGNVHRTLKVLEKKMKNGQQKSNMDAQEFDAEFELKREKLIQSKLKIASHTGYAVTGIAVDSINSTMITVGLDSKLIMWNFTKRTPMKKSPFLLSAPATKLHLVRDSDLAAIALEDYSVVLFDCNAMQIVRQFGKGNAKHSGSICDLTFSPDGRTLYTASLDSTIRVWDVPTNTCIDWLKFKSPPISMTISPTGEFLATAHIGKLGISLWSDRSYYQTIHTDGKYIAEPYQMDEPVPIGDVIETDDLIKDQNRTKLITNEETQDDDDEKVPAIPKESGLITLSALPPSHWKNLFHLELVKERNKPKEAPKKPPTAPFFLQWRKGESVMDDIPGLDADKPPTKEDNGDEWAAAWSDDDEEENNLSEKTSERRKRDGHKDSVKRRKVTHFRSHLASLLESSSKKSVSQGDRQYQEVSDYIATLGPSAIDIALSSLCNGVHDLSDGVPSLTMACEWLKEACQSRERYDAVNAYLHRFLYLHATVIAGIESDSVTNTKDKKEDEENNLMAERMQLIQLLSEIRHAQSLAADRIREKMEHTLCLLRHFSRMV